MGLRIVRLASAALLLYAATVFAQESPKEDLYNFLSGKYLLIGQRPDSKTTYAGSVLLKNSRDSLEVSRTMNGMLTRGTGRITEATADKVQVLEVRFTDGKLGYVATYMIHSDLDNYGRLTGYLYLQDGTTKSPGLEALFIDHRALD